MLFSSLVFLWFFFPAVMLLYFLAPGRTAKNIVLLIVSLFFYSFGEPKYIFLVLLTTILCFLAGLGMEACGGQSRKKRWIAAFFILAQLFILGYFKYFNFAADTLNRLTARELLSLREIALPLGISFYTFQAISYIVDTYRGRSSVQKNLFHLALYICLFPQILSGPIIKYHELEHQLINRRETTALYAYGIKRFAYGLAKKVLLANTFGQAVDRIMVVPAQQLGTATAWLAIVLYALQLYYDFSGYSDMAIGLGRMFGFFYGENFDYPYLSRSITEFWRRWHISLSSWFKEYLYISLGGNRKGLSSTCINLFIVFLATGLWHGASMNFILWGIYHGFFIILERFWLSRLLEKNSFKFVNHLYTIIVVLFGWLLFRVADMNTVRTLLTVMVIPSKGMWNPAVFANGKILFCAAFGILFCGPVQAAFPALKKRLFDEEGIKLFDIAVMTVLVLLSTIAMVSSTYNAFIYFN